MRIALVCAVMLATACSKKRAEQVPPKAPEAPQAPAAEQKRFITSASGVRLRATASADGAEVTKLPVGTVLTSIGASPDPAWAHVALGNGQQGWISTTVIRELDAAHPEDTYLDLAQQRNAKEDLSFPERADLYWTLTHAIENSRDHATLAKLELARIIALKKALAAGAHAEGDADKQYEGFAKQLGDAVVYSEPDGRYFPETEKLWLSAKTFADVPQGEMIAWEAGSTPQPGECEGYFGCDVTIVNISEGRYLKDYPKGAHAAQALEAYEQLDAPDDKTFYEDWDGETLQSVNDSLNEADAILAACAPEASKAAKAKLAADRKLIAKMTRSKK